MINLQSHKSEFILLIDFSNDWVYYIKANGKKDQVFTIELESEIDEFEFEKVSKNTLLHFVGTGIINRKLELSEVESTQLFTQGQEDLFYVQHFETSKFDFVSFVRKEKIDTVLDKLPFKNNVVSIGPFILGEKSRQDFDLIFEGNELIDFSKNKTFKFEKETAFFYASYVSRNISAEKVLSIYDGEELVKRLTEINERKKFVSLSVGILSVILILLIVNYFVQSKFLNENRKLEEDIQLYGNNLALIDQLNLEIERKQRLIESSGIYNSKALSKYIDEVVETIPTEIRLQNFVLFPAANKLKQKKRLEVQKTSLIIKGEVSDSYAFENWIIKLEKISWVEEVVIKNYQKGKVSSVFDLEIIL